MIKFSVRQKTSSIHFVFNDNKRKLTRSLRTTAATTNRFEKNIQMKIKSIPNEIIFLIN